MLTSRRLHCRQVALTCYAAALSLVVHILCIYYARACHFIDRCHYRSLVATMNLARACLLHMQCVRQHIMQACKRQRCKRSYIKAPPRGSVVLNTTTRCAQPQATAGDQSNGSSKTSALRVQLINSKWVSYCIATWCSGLHIR